MNQNNQEPTKYLLTMRSKTTFGVDASELAVWPGQDPQEVAERVASGYGATVESVALVGE